MRDEPEAPANSFRILELSAELGAVFEKRDRSGPVELPGRRPTGCDQCLRTVWAATAPPMASARPSHVRASPWRPRISQYGCGSRQAARHAPPRFGQPSQAPALKIRFLSVESRKPQIGVEPKLGFRRFRKVEEVVPVPARELVCLAARRQPLAGVLPDRLEHPVALLVKRSEALLDERLQGVDIGVARPPRRPRACSRLRRRRGGRRAPALRVRGARSDHSIVALRVCWRGSASRPPFRRSRRPERRSRIWAGESAVVRAAASSTASGSESRRAHSSAISSVGSSCARSQKSATASGSASGGTAYSTSPWMRRSSRRGDEEREVGAGREKRASSGAASITCSRLSSRRSSSRSADVGGEIVLGAEVCAIVSVRVRDRAGRRARPRRRLPCTRGRA